MLKSVYEEEFQRAADEDEGRTPLKLQPSISILEGIMAYASGNKAWGISDRSGFRFPFARDEA